MEIGHDYCCSTMLKQYCPAGEAQCLSKQIYFIFLLCDHVFISQALGGENGYNRLSHRK